mmetsp:Transcript_12759/g.38286  ORF Transcript_12759/g.38286 Transcript_12759/m.38286 type:complete len:260 (-) Transcript_12759:2555-3334(-)
MALPFSLASSISYCFAVSLVCASPILARISPFSRWQRSSRELSAVSRASKSRSSSSSWKSRTWRSSDALSSMPSVSCSRRSAYTRSSKSRTSCVETATRVSRSATSRSRSSRLVPSRFRLGANLAPSFSACAALRTATPGRSAASSSSPAAPVCGAHRSPLTCGSASADSGCVAIGAFVPSAPGGSIATERTLVLLSPSGSCEGSARSLKDVPLSRAALTAARAPSVMLSRHSGNSATWNAPLVMRLTLPPSCSSASIC